MMTETWGKCARKPAYLSEPSTLCDELNDTRYKDRDLDTIQRRREMMGNDRINLDMKNEWNRFGLKDTLF